jgi:hypothetical protein
MSTTQQRRKEILEKLSKEEASALGLVQDDELDELHSELGIVEEEEEVIEEEEEVAVEEEPEEEIVVEKKPAKKSTPKTIPKKKATSKKTATKPDVSELLKNISIDINNIEFTEKSPLEKIDDIDFILNGKPTFQVIANQSAYIAHMESIRLADINSLTNSSADIYATKQKLYKTIWSKINTTSVGKMDFKTWLKVTSFYDLPSLMYGIYCQTFPGDTTFEINCRHCHENTDVVVNNDTLITVKDEETYSKLNEIINNVTKSEELLNNSIVNKYSRTVLPTSKILVDIQTPSLWNHLELLASVDKNLVDEMQDVLGTMMFLKNIFVIDTKELQRSGKAKYYSIDDKNQIIQILRNLEVFDAKALGDAIAQRSDKYAIGYKIKNFKCSKCNNDVGEIPVDVEQLLFSQILQM